MQTIAIFAAVKCITVSAAFAGHPHVADAARRSTGNQSGNASAGWDALVANPSGGKAAAAADKR